MFDKKFLAAPNSSSKVSFFKRMKTGYLPLPKFHADSIEKIREDSFGHWYFIMLIIGSFKLFIICMYNDGTKLAHKIKFNSLNVQAGDVINMLIQELMSQ